MNPIDNHAITVWNVANVVVVNLNTKAAGEPQRDIHGLFFWCDDGFRLDNVVVAGVECSGHGGFGISAIGLHWSAFTNFVVADVDAHHNVSGGIQLYGDESMPPVFRNVYFTRIDAHDNPGRVIWDMSGGGIGACVAENVLIEHCRAWDNGYEGNYCGGIGAGWHSRRVVIQLCESWGNRSRDGIDGVGLFLDCDYQDSVIQYCYGHDNEGADVILYGESAPGRTARHSGARYNLCAGGGYRGGYGTLMVLAGNHIGTFLHNNTVIAPVAGVGALHLEYLAAGDEVLMANNLLVAGDSTPLVRLAGVAGAHLNFRRNAYYQLKGRPLWQVEGRTIRKWGQWLPYDSEGLLTDPHLSGGNGLDAFQLAADSPLIGAGIDLAVLGLDNGGRDYWGNILPVGPCTIGAHEPA